MVSRFNAISFVLQKITKPAAPCLMFSCPLVSISVSYLLEGGAVDVKVNVGVFNCVYTRRPERFFVT